MNLSETLIKKTDMRDAYKEKYNLPKRSKILIALCCKDTKIIKKIQKGLAVLPANFIIFWKVEEQVEAKNVAYESDYLSFDMMGVDAVINDGEGMKIEKSMSVWVVPILPEKNYLGKILSEFHAGRGEGNAFLFEQDSPWSMYYALVRYIENHKFPYDNRNLVKNTLWV